MIAVLIKFANAMPENFDQLKAKVPCRKTFLTQESAVNTQHRS